MQVEVAGYVLGDALYEIEEFVTYRARHVVTNEAFLARGPRKALPALVDVGRLEHELALLGGHESAWPGVMRPLRRIDGNHNSFLIYEHHRGIPLDQVRLETRWSLEDSLLVVRELLLAVASCHQRGVLHCSISPRTVIWDTDSGELALTHFIHARAPKQELQSETTASLSAFSAPEQSGQMTAGVDQRSDLYSVGAVLYWLLTGAPPVAAAKELSELMHNLVARQPVEVSQLRDDVPPGVADVLNRLLNKSPGDRPQTAAEVLELLNAVGLQLAASGSSAPSSEPPLGWPSLHGRETELAALHTAVRDAATGATRVVFVSGPPGSGKSRLTDELRLSLPRERYLWASGKFEQYRQPRPYSALVNAMSELFDLFLTSSDEGLGYWRQRFLSVDTNLRAVLVDQIPPLRHIVGEHKSPPRLGPSEMQNRFQLAFRALLEALCGPEHPLVLTIDDVQWSDDETVALLAESFIGNRSGYLVLVLAYRPKEAAAAPRVMELINGHAARTDLTRRIELEQLAAIDIAALCEDMVSPCPQSSELTRRVQRDCRGNPLFALEVIKHFRQNGGLKWSTGLTGGEWHFEPVTTPGAAPDNVVDFIVSRIDALPELSRVAVLMASCLGHSFDAGALRLATGLSAEALRDGLGFAVAEGMIVAQSPAATSWLSRSPQLRELDESLTFSFAHDRIQQAAHSLCSPHERERLHLTVGRALATRAVEEPSFLFGAVEHLNAVDSMLEPTERRQLAELNLIAGRSAKDMIAYGTATGLFEKALAITAVTERTLRFKLLLELAESRYLCANFEPAEAAFAAALEEAQSVEEQVLVHRTQLVLYQHQQRYAEAISLGLRALALLGVNLPVNPSPPRLAASLGATMLRLRNLDVKALQSEPDRATDRDRLALDLLVLLWTPCFWTNQKLCGLVVLQLIERTTKLGNTPQAPMAYACFAILNHVLLKRHERALEFGDLAVNVMSSATEPFIASRVRFLTLTFFGALRRENRANVEAYEQALANCLSNGEHVFAGHTIDGITTSLPIHGFRLPEIERRLDACRATAERISSEPSIELIAIIRGWCRALSEGPGVASGPRVDELRFDSYLGVHLMLQMATCYLWEEDEQVIALLAKLRSNVVIQSNPLHAGFYAFFGALSLCRQSASKNKRKIRALVAKVAAFERIFPRNFSSSLLLLRAETARHSGNFDEALEGYHRAIAEANERGHDLVHAIACERLAGLYEARGDVQGNHEYLRVAAHSYGRFGASAKVARLASRHPGYALIEEPATLAPNPHLVDLRAEAVMRAAYAIAEETQSDRLADTLLSVVTTAAGAQRALLLKPDGLKWLTLASWSGERQEELEARGLPRASRFSEGAVRYVARTKSTVHIHDARDPRFLDDPYLRDNLPRSVLCLPLLHRGELVAVLYLENSICADVFTTEQRQLAAMLGHQAAIAMAIADYHKVQIDALQAKINPHFLHNALSVIAELVVSQPQLAEAAILKLSKLYRYVLNSSAGQVVSLDQELAITRDYLALEGYRFGSRLRVEFAVSGPTGQVMVPALLLQPLVENAVRHGVARNDGGTVRVVVAVGAEDCRLVVADDGPGWHEGKGGSGFGLKSVVDRLKLLYRDDFELSIDKGAGVAIEIRFKLKLAPSGIRPMHAVLTGSVG